MKKIDFVKLTLFCGSVALFCASCAPAPDPDRWWKGNLHTHTLWSDGDDFPEMVTAWYKDNGYDFLAISDHNLLHENEKWVDPRNTPSEQHDLQAYIDRFGSDWVVTRDEQGETLVRLKTLSEYRPLFEEPGEFLLIQAEEISNWFENKLIHVNAINLREPIPAPEGTSVLDIMQKSVDAVLEQRERTGQPMFPHLNHPNFLGSIMPEDLIEVRGERFFEVYNGHPAEKNEDGNEGGGDRPSTERLWDIVLTGRLLQGLEILYGLATDDAHEYHQTSSEKSNPGRGWVMVNAPELSSEAIVAAMETGNFYSSTGVTLTDIEHDDVALRISIDAESSIAYTTQFIGTRRGATALGEVLAEVAGTAPSYTFNGDELYVRATIRSSKPKENPNAVVDETERAWTQPVVPF